MTLTESSSAPCKPAMFPTNSRRVVVPDAVTSNTCWTHVPSGVVVIVARRLPSHLTLSPSVFPSPLDEVEKVSV